MGRYSTGVKHRRPGKPWLHSYYRSHGESDHRTIPQLVALVGRMETHQAPRVPRLAAHLARSNHDRDGSRFNPGRSISGNGHGVRGVIGMRDHLAASSITHSRIRRILCWTPLLIMTGITVLLLTMMLPGGLLRI